MSDEAGLPKQPPKAGTGARGYHVRVGWIVPDKRGDYLQRSKGMTIHATSLREACDIALERQRNYICVAVEAAWLEWPQLPVKDVT